MKSLPIPSSIVSKIDLGRLLQELEKANEDYHQAALRKTATTYQVSPLLTDLAASQECDIAKSDERQELLELVSQLHKGAPLIHISFAASPSAAFTSKLLTWLRSEIHPQLLLHIGLQPSIAAGCTIRTTNKYFDFSLRKGLESKKSLLIQKLEEAKQ